MPEKVHKRFENVSDFQPKEAFDRVSLEPNSDRSTLISITKTNKLTGTKRLRDGSPKVERTASFHGQPRGQKRSQKPDSSLHPKTKKIFANPHGSSTRKPVTEEVSNEDKQTARSHESPSSATSFHEGCRQGPNLNRYSDKSKDNKRSINQPARQAAAMLEKTRRKLPIWAKQANIRWALRNNDVLLLNGETGSGKSTQVPQFLHTEPWCKRKKVEIETKDGKKEDVLVGGMIAITQPRRVAAITLAHRVAREMGTPLVKTSVQGMVGYSVRFDSLVPNGAKIKFLTEGTLLQEMLHDPFLRKYSAVIVDEIHERSVDVDLLSGFLREIVHGDKKGRGGIPLKLVVMSATLDLGGIEAFFATLDTKSAYKPDSNYGDRKSVV